MYLWSRGALRAHELLYPVVLAPLPWVVSPDGPVGLSTCFPLIPNCPVASRSTSHPSCSFPTSNRVRMCLCTVPYRRRTDDVVLATSPPETAGCTRGVVRRNSPQIDNKLREVLVNIGSCTS